MLATKTGWQCSLSRREAPRVRLRRGWEPDGSNDRISCIGRELGSGVLASRITALPRDGDQLMIQFERPEPIERVLAPRNAEFQTTNVLYGLQNRYAHHNENPKNGPSIA